MNVATEHSTLQKWPWQKIIALSGAMIAIAFGFAVLAQSL